jgi:ferrochelatase
LFLDAVADRVRAALQSLPAERRASARVIFTAHSIPASMAADAPYEAQVHEGAAAVAARLGLAHHAVAYQSRSGNPRDPWLGPDIAEAIRQAAAQGARDLVVMPLGFLCDHVEVLYDLDVEAREVAAALGVGFVRADTVNDHPSFIRMLADVVARHARA